MISCVRLSPKYINLIIVAFEQALELLELDGETTEALGSDLLQQLLMGHHMVDFWINICICHSLIVEDHPSGGKVYQASHSIMHHQ